MEQVKGYISVRMILRPNFILQFWMILLRGLFIGIGKKLYNWKRK